MLSTVAWQMDGKLTYALEGSVYVAGSLVQWLRDGMGFIEQSADVEELALKEGNNGGITIIPALTGLGAPHWDSYARGAIMGITRGTNTSHIAYAALEAIALGTADVLEAMAKDMGEDLKSIKVDGGASANDTMMQIQSDLLGCPVIDRWKRKYRTRCALLAGLGTGIWSEWKAQRIGRDRPNIQPSGWRLYLLRQQWNKGINSTKAGLRPVQMNRAESIIDLKEEEFDILIIGGGATGLGAAVDAASRGYKVGLLEGTISPKEPIKSTKLAHGSVRYLQNGDISLVIEALRERGLLCQNAPHLVKNLGFVIPSYDWWNSPFYGIGLKIYDLMAGRLGLGPSEMISKDEVLDKIPNVETKGLRGGVLYHDGQFDDARLAISLARTANLMELFDLLQSHGFGQGRGPCGWRYCPRYHWQQ